eukprot:957648-Amphidinium_carterae.1
MHETQRRSKSSSRVVRPAPPLLPCDAPHAINFTKSFLCLAQTSHTQDMQKLDDRSITDTMADDDDEDEERRLMRSPGALCFVVLQLCSPFLLCCLETSSVQWTWDERTNTNGVSVSIF